MHTLHDHQPFFTPEEYLQNASFYIPEREIPFFDQKIDDAITVPVQCNHEITMIIGIENMEGKVYREITAYTFDDFTDLIAQLARLHLVDVFPASYYVTSGYDSRLRFTH
ncbi:MAG: hypothetical protein ACRC53_03420 [Plesiomonas sp.]|uniref:hypothetical protein n=1 Tax=Plesiomonas sp. TaxID=2486279 RepID=UPI003F2D2E1E